MIQPSTASLLLPRRPASAPVKAGRRGRRRMLREEACRPRGALLGTPLLHELGRRLVGQCQGTALDVVDAVQEGPQLPAGVRVVLVLRQVAGASTSLIVRISRSTKPFSSGWPAAAMLIRAPTWSRRST